MQRTFFFGTGPCDRVDLILFLRRVLPFQKEKEACSVFHKTAGCKVGTASPGYTSCLCFLSVRNGGLLLQPYSVVNKVQSVFAVEHHFRILREESIVSLLADFHCLCY